MKKILIFFILLTLTIQLAFAGTDYKPNQKDLKIISSINSKIDKIVQNKGSDSSSKLLDKLIKIENKIQNDERLTYIMKSLIQNLTLQITLYEVDNYDEVKKDVNQKTSTLLEIKIYDDIRCKTCNTDELINRLYGVPALTNVKIHKKDFADQEVVGYLKDNNIKNLPLIIFPNNFIDPGLNEYLKPIGNGEFFLEINANFDPYAKRSDRGILQIELSELEKIKNNSYIKGELDAEIIWLEYSDLECPYCARLHNSTTGKELTTKYGDNLSIIFNHFPLSFHTNAQSASEALECIGNTNGSDTFYTVIEQSYIKYDNNNFDLNGLYNIAEAEGVNKDALIKCVDSGTYTDKVTNQMNIGQNTFGVTGTPGNVLINTITGEYIVLSGAYPTASFEEIIDTLLLK